jgi:hypothetical protein
MSGSVAVHYRRNVSAVTLLNRGISVEIGADIDSVAGRDICWRSLVSTQLFVARINLKRGANAFINVWPKSLVRRCDAHCLVRR